MIIFGWRGRAGVIARGVFACPHCGADRQYLHKRMRRWFTLFFIPVIPLNALGEFVQCESCKQSFKTMVLDAPTTATLQNELAWAMREALTTLLRASRTPGAESAATTILIEVSGHSWTEQELAADIAGLDTAHLQARLAMLAGVLNDQGKERFLTMCAQVATTGGVIDVDARAAVEQIAAGLLMTPAHTRGIIDQTADSARA
jgi:hypothetical protein